MPAEPYPLAFPVVLLCLELLLAGAWIARLRTRAAAAVGPVLVAVEPARRARAIGAAAIVALALAAAFAQAVPWPLAIVAAGLGAWIQLARPGIGDRVCGERGVRRGWHARSWSELEEWRLTGDHLRLRLQGEWTAVDLPGALQGDVRRTLETLVPERQSRFPQ